MEPLKSDVLTGSAALDHAPGVDPVHGLAIEHAIAAKGGAEEGAFAVSEANLAMSEESQTKGCIHSAMHHAAKNIAPAIRKVD